MRTQKDGLILFLITLAALLYRLDYLIASGWIIDADEAIVGLMGRHILEGRSWPVFYYGQHYMGSFEALVAACFFKVLGPSSFALKLVPTFFSVLLVPLVYRLTLGFGGVFAARTAALLTALPPAALLEWGCRARGGFIEILFFGVIVLILVQRFVRSNGRDVYALTAASFLLGFGWWVNTQIIYFFLPVGLAGLSVLLQRHSNRFKFFFSSFAIALSAFFFGSLPFWVYNFQHNFASFGLFERASLTEGLEHAAGVFSTSLPILLGAGRFWTGDDIFPLSSVLVLSVYGLLFLRLLRDRHQDLFFWRGESGQRPLYMPVSLAIWAFLVFSASSFGYLVQAPRYLLPVYVALYPLIGCALELCAAYRRVYRLLPGFLLLLNLASFYYPERAIPGEPIVYRGERVSKDHSELISWLDGRGYQFVKTNYWIGYRLAFESEEKIRFRVFSEPGQVRIKDWEDLAGGHSRAEDVPMVLVPAQARLVRDAFKAMGLDYREVLASGYHVLYDVQPKEKDLIRVSSEGLSAQASEHGESAHLAIDGNLDTRWGSGQAQKSGMIFTIELAQAQSLRSIRYHLSHWEHDYPRALRIELEDETGKRVRAVKAAESEALRFVEELNPDVSFYFQPVRAKKVIFTQMGSDRVFDWSFAEIELYR